MSDMICSTGLNARRTTQLVDAACLRVRTPHTMELSAGARASKPVASDSTSTHNTYLTVPLLLLLVVVVGAVLEQLSAPAPA